MSELQRFDESLSQRPMLVALNKMDLPEVNESYERIAREMQGRGYKLYGISAASREGIEALLQEIERMLNNS